MTTAYLAWIQQMCVRGLPRNGLFSMLQTLVTIICVFLGYRILIGYQGIASLGLWSLLSMFGGVANTFDVSGASALARSVSRHQTEFNDTTKGAIVHTVLLTSFAINSILVVIFLIAAWFIIPNIVSKPQLNLAWSLIPWVVSSMLLTPLAVGISSSIDGVLRADKRAILISFSVIFSLVVAWIAIRKLGVIGLAMAQCLQQVLVIIGGWLLLRHHVDDLGWLPLRWRHHVFKRTTGYAIRLNIVAVFGLMLEPLTKYLINQAGGTSAVGIYELAARLVMQLRQLIVSSATPLIPVFAVSIGPKDTDFVSLLRRSQNISKIAAIVLTILSLIFAPFMCLAIIGFIPPNVLRFSALLAFGWGFNIFSLPVYLAAQGQGKLRFNILSHAVIGFVVILVSRYTINIYGATGVVMAISLGLVFGSLVNIVGNTMMFDRNRLQPKEMFTIIMSALLMAAACAAMWFSSDLIARQLSNQLHV